MKTKTIGNQGVPGEDVSEPTQTDSKRHYNKKTATTHTDLDFLYKAIELSKLYSEDFELTFNGIQISLKKVL